MGEGVMYELKSRKLSMVFGLLPDLIPAVLRTGKTDPPSELLYSFTDKDSA